MRSKRIETPISALRESLPKLVEKGISDKKIADMFSVSETTVRNYRKKIGIINRKRNVFKSKVLSKKELVQLIKDKWNIINSSITSNDPNAGEQAVDALRFLNDHCTRQEIIVIPLKNDVIC